MNHPVDRHRRPGAIALAFAVATVLLATACEPVPPPDIAAACPTNTSGTTTTTAPAGSGDIGWEGPSFQGASGSPSGSKPESKLWFNDGVWWADLWDTSTGDFYIHRLDLTTRQWVRTPTRLDDRSDSRSDAVWDGTHLFVASHAFAEGASTTATGYPARLRRFSYQPSTDTYTLDPGFPVQINDARSESLVIERDSLGRIWATWTQNKRVMAAVSTVGGTSFAAPYALPVTGSSVASDDISSVVAFAGNRIGIMWSNQNDETMYFSSRLDSAAAGTWGPAEVAYTGTSAADDHINLKNVADQGGRVLAAVKTSQSGSSPLVHLLDRNPVTGAWSSHVFGLGSDSHTRPIVVVDRSNQSVQMFATSGQSGGSIYRKTAPLSNITFPAGKGTAVLTDADSADINNATSTKQAVDTTSGLVVLATNDATRRYWTHYDDLGGAPASQPVASFTATPTSGPAPLWVCFVNTSTGSPTSYSWTFGDGATSTNRTVLHRYENPGTYTVTMQATNGVGTGTVTRTNLITVGTPPPVGNPVTFLPTADAQVKSTSAGTNYGTDPALRTRGGSPAYASYLRFDVTGLAAAPSSARLRLFVTDATDNGGPVQPTSAAWTETGITWSNAPAPTGAALAAIGPTTLGQWVDVDVTPAVTGNGVVALYLSSPSTNSGLYGSRESATPPQLVVTP